MCLPPCPSLPPQSSSSCKLTGRLLSDAWRQLQSPCCLMPVVVACLPTVTCLPSQIWDCSRITTWDAPSQCWHGKNVNWTGGPWLALLLTDLPCMQGGSTAICSRGPERSRTLPAPP